MRLSLHSFKLWAALGVCAVLAACGGGGGSDSSASTSTPNSNPQTSTIQGNTSISQVIASPGANAAALTVAQAPAPSGVVVANVPMVSVVVCSTTSQSSCTTVNNIQVDTGSSGLRVLSSALTSILPTLAQVPAPGGANVLAECMSFADGTAFGSVRDATVTVAGETATNIPIEVIGDGTTPQPTNGQPGTCESLTNQSTPDLLHANGILGVGTAPNDCASCIAGSDSSSYFTCVSGSSCSPLSSHTVLTTAQVVVNPVTKFPVDNNGVIIELPSVAATGAPTVTGALVFGIGTQANNGLGSAQVLQTDAFGNISTTFQGTTVSSSFFDSGSNSLFFASSGVTLCSDGTFYCPASTQSFSAMLAGTNGVNASINFSVANADTLTASGNFAFNDQAGTTASFFSTFGPTFDWGLPAFYGRNVFTSIAGTTIS
ncbi:MAG TPA: DUF3443 family protein, partial [Pararobbsia sp.]|nr:DUF3443 family protein [Pararobbsia sp.]